MGIDSGSAAIFGLVMLFVANRLIFLGDDWHQRRVQFWGVQALNLAVACALVVWGFPGIGPNSRMMSALIAGVVVLHILLNSNRLQRELLAERRARREALEAENAALRAELRLLEQDQGEPSE